MKRYLLNEPRPEFKNGDIVKVDMGQLGAPDLGIMEGRIVGKWLFNNFPKGLDIWFVDFGAPIFGEEYPFSVAAVSHPSMIKE